MVKIIDKWRSIHCVWMPEGNFAVFVVTKDWIDPTSASGQWALKNWKVLYLAPWMQSEAGFSAWDTPKSRDWSYLLCVCVCVWVHYFPCGVDDHGGSLDQIMASATNQQSILICEADLWNCGICFESRCVVVDLRSVIMDDYESGHIIMMVHVCFFSCKTSLNPWMSFAHSTWVHIIPYLYISKYIYYKHTSNYIFKSW